MLDEIDARRDRQNVGLLRVFGLYRLIVSITLLILFFQGEPVTRLGESARDVFSVSLQLYAIVNLLILIAVNFLPGAMVRRNVVVTAIVALDAVAITWFMYWSGGVSSGLAPLLLVSVAAGAILTASRVSIFLAAFTSVALLFEETYLMLVTNSEYEGIFQAGVFGVLFFAGAQLIHSISERLREGELKAMTQAVELADLERVNRRIIQRMRTGILVIDNADHVRMGNHSAYSLLGLGAAHDNPAERWSRRDSDQELPDELVQHLQAWRKDINYRSLPFQVASETPEIRANFSAVRAGAVDADVIVFLEDTSEIQQQAQQLKLAALGRLSASIAHEIRNPLGAVAHAAQLLGESEHIDPGDTRLIDIINSHSKRMNSVIENILELSRRKAPEPSRLELLPVLEQFAKQFCVAELLNARIDITVEPQTTEVRIDRSQFIQVLTNLAQNGLRYSLQHTGGLTLTLQGGIDATTDRPFLNVIDDGPGVDEEHRSTLFEPFFTTENSGSGLGLYIAREMCEANQARLSYVALADRGACFRLTFAHPDRITI